MRWGWCTICLLLLTSGLTAQRIDTELIWRVRGMPSPDKIAKALRVERLTPHILKLHYTDPSAAREAYAMLSRDKRTLAVQYNYRVNFRAVPNDPGYDRQDNLRRAGFERVWDTQTGGFTSNGTPIVIAVLDAGFDTDHEDLADNLWVNPGEIPGDGIDNDGNGLTDDLHGYDYVAGSGRIQSSVHGTQVAGLLAARGDNGLGVSGTNWNGHLMLFRIATVADIVAAYAYVVDQRRLWNETGGRRGAFVVVTNASFGVENARCEDFPVWKAMYDELGEVGVLTAAGVANADRDIDRAGDVPLDCPTDFLIGVTNVDRQDVRFRNSGYGRRAVDLGAPGEGSYTTRPGNRYGSFGGSSAATAYVAGAVALLYATDCDALLEAVAFDPAGAALWVREALLTTVAPTSSLAGRTKTGGRLDVASAQRYLRGTCVRAPNQERLGAFPNPTSGVTTVVLNDVAAGTVTELRLTDVLGRLVLRRTITVSSGRAHRLYLGKLPPGVYLLWANTGHDQESQLRIVKR